MISGRHAHCAQNAARSQYPASLFDLRDVSQCVIVSIEAFFDETARKRRCRTNTDGVKRLTRYEGNQATAKARRRSRQAGRQSSGQAPGNQGAQGRKSRRPRSRGESGRRGTGLHRSAALDHRSSKPVRTPGSTERNQDGPMATPFFITSSEKGSSSRYFFLLVPPGAPSATPRLFPVLPV